MPDKRDMHKAKSHRNSHNKSQTGGHRGNPSASQQLDARDAASRPSGLRPGEPGASTTAGPTAAESSGAADSVGKRNKNRR
jgi:hypothetical protein